MKTNFHDKNFALYNEAQSNSEMAYCRKTTTQDEVTLVLQLRFALNKDKGNEVAVKTNIAIDVDKET